jgi:hypothetical protein
LPGISTVAPEASAAASTARVSAGIVRGQSDLLVRGFRQLGLDVGRGFLAVHCDDQGLLAAALRRLRHRRGAGGGARAGAHAGAAAAAAPVRLTAPAALRTSRRIRFVYDRLAAELGGLPA